MQTWTAAIWNEKYGRGGAQRVTAIAGGSLPPRGLRTGTALLGRLLSGSSQVCDGLKVQIVLGTES